MPVSFPFREEESPIFGKINRPIAEVFFKDQIHNLWQPVTMIVDTGADYTLLPLFLAEELGVNIEKNCRVIVTQGVGGTSKVYLLRNKIEVKIGEYHRKIPVGFLHNDYIPPLLGRLDVWDKFSWFFDNKRQQVVFEKIK